MNRTLSSLIPLTLTASLYIAPFLVHAQDAKVLIPWMRVEHVTGLAFVS